MVQTTPLARLHESSGAKLVDFAGWLMPLQYSGMLEEHGAVRSGAGIFDIGHMGQIEVFDAGALQSITTNDVSALGEWSGQYSFMCTDRGTVVDDLLVYRLKDRFLVISNAVNTQKVFSKIKEKDPLSQLLYGRNTAIAIQGPKAMDISGRALRTDFHALKHRGVMPVPLGGSASGLASRSGYTGEDGIELFFDAGSAEEVWKELIAAGASPCGLGSRDILRIEAGLPLYGHELDENTTPIEAGYERFVKYEKGDFAGKTRLLEQRSSGPLKKLVGFELLGRSVPRQGFKLYEGTSEIGQVTSGTYSPSLKKPVGMAYLYPSKEDLPASPKLVVRDTGFDVSFLPLPFYKRKKV